MKQRGCFRTAKDKAARLSWLTGRRWSVERRRNGFAVLQDGGEERLFSRLREVEAFLLDEIIRADYARRGWPLPP